jgi:hypothetical protein
VRHIAYELVFQADVLRASATMVAKWRTPAVEERHYRARRRAGLPSGAAFLQHQNEERESLRSAELLITLER